MDLEQIAVIVPTRKEANNILPFLHYQPGRGWLHAALLRAVLASSLTKPFSMREFLTVRGVGYRFDG